MRKQLLRFWATITGKRKIVQAKREANYLKHRINKDTEFIKLLKKAKTPEEFVNAVNGQMQNVYHFKDFKLKDVKIINIFSSQHYEFLHTVYALEKPYGIFYVIIDTREVFFKFTEEINWELEKAETFRIYCSSEKKASKNCDIFYQCKLKKGIVKIYGVYQEWQNCEGNFEVFPYDVYNIKFPANFEDM